MAIDSHAHYNNELTEKLESLIERIKDSKDIEAIVNIAMDIKTSNEITLLSQGVDKVYNTIGIHPLRDGDASSLLDLYYGTDNSKIVAIGEMGLDSSDPDLQRQTNQFIEQIELANYLKVPIVIHSLNYNKEVLDILRDNKPLYGYVFHCFQPDLDIARRIICNGGYISIGGPVTYKTARKSIEVVRLVPLENMLVETDSPYMAPEPMRGTVNNSFNLKYIIEKVAEIKQMEYGQVEEATTYNVKQLFKKMR